MNATVLLALFLLLSSVSYGEAKKRNKLLVLSLDGFGHSLFTSHPNETLALRKLFIENGLFASDGMIPTFSSQTLPNHFSMATGLYQETHGIIGNYFYDLQLKKSFSCGVNSDDSIWFNDFAEPIWSIAEKQGVKTLVTNWFTSQVNFTANFTKPSFTRKFERHILQRDLDDAIDMLFKFNAVDLAMVYHHEPDNTTHRTGTNSTEVRDILTSINSSLTNLHERLVRENLTDSINIVIVSDHGAANVQQSLYLLDLAPNIVNCSKLIDNGGAILHIFTRNESCTENVYSQLEMVQKKLQTNRSNAQMRVFKRPDTPVSYHYQNHPRIGDILIEGSTGVHVVKDQWVYTDWPRPKADHGWNHTHPLMKSIFVARGPLFKRTNVSSSQVVEYYNLITTVLDLKGNANNGTVNFWNGYLNSYAASHVSSSTLVIVLLSIVTWVCNFAQIHF